MSVCFSQTTLDLRLDIFLIFFPAALLVVLFQARLSSLHAKATCLYVTHLIQCYLFRVEPALFNKVNVIRLRFYVFKSCVQEAVLFVLPTTICHKKQCFTWIYVGDLKKKRDNAHLMLY